MTPSNFPARRIGGLAIAIGGVTLIGIVSIILFFTFGASSVRSTTCVTGSKPI